ncbi:DsbA family oxidoreductase [Yinghuangia sp. ASG 101]|uniref:DsbA family oxidoreductase n=1 Tax=Yinghuangia sp. ASG 101 TaxID=2896848 RepID=UPI001E64A45D|nr:DsbA family oxidoreductase [Yinghuangia sp. ASG 101]UGQ11781.1 DsbA family oxidoreductase [Yinghuangia sp. ASG 101]
MPEMTVEIWSDVVCPWCAIGRRRLEAALDEFPHRDSVEVILRAYELDPGATVDGVETLPESMVRRGGGTLDRALARAGQVEELAAADGLEFCFAQARPVNTFDAHRLLHHALHRGGPDTQRTLLELLTAAYAREGRNIADHETLLELAGEAGLDTGEAAGVLAGDEHADSVRDDVRRGLSIGLSGVPFVVVDGRVGVAGAQPRETYASALSHAWTTRSHRTDEDRAATP